MTLNVVKDGFDPEGLEYAVGMVFGDITADIMPTTNGVRLFEAGERPNLSGDNAGTAWHFAVIYHTAALIMAYYRGWVVMKRHGAEPGADP